MIPLLFDEIDLIIEKYDDFFLNFNKISSLLLYLPLTKKKNSR